MPDASSRESRTDLSPTEEKLKLVYVLTTDGKGSYADMALVSMLSAGLTNPDISTLLLIDEQSLDVLERSHHKILQINASIVAIATPPGSAVFRSRWIKTQAGHLVRGNVVYLDSDTLVRKPIDDLSQMKGVFGAVADAPGLSPSEDPRRLAISRSMGWSPDHTYYNGGFFYYQSTPEVDRFFERWHSLWLDMKSETNLKDQPSFNAAITLADFDAVDLSESYNHQITLSWTNCQQSNIWHFWESSRMSGDILEELTNLSTELPIDQLTNQVDKAIKKRSPAGFSNRLAVAMDLLSIDTEIQRKLLIQKSRLSAKEFLKWSLKKLVSPGPRKS